MKDFVVWLDSKNAHVFSLAAEGVTKTTVTKNDYDHHSRHKNDLHTDRNADHYYKDLSLQLKGADQLLLMGPGTAKHRFKDYLATHRGGSALKKISSASRILKALSTKLKGK